jgi:hypothetical protein
MRGDRSQYQYEYIQDTLPHEDITVDAAGCTPPLHHADAPPGEEVALSSLTWCDMTLLFCCPCCIGDPCSDRRKSGSPPPPPHAHPPHPHRPS